MKTTERTIVYGAHRGISFEVYLPRDNYKFTYYIYLHLRNFTDNKLAESLWIHATEGFLGIASVRYSLNEFLANLNMHGGITFYSKRLMDGDSRAIMIGCDYGHSCDQERYYGIDAVLSDVVETINDLHRKTQYLLFCIGNGKLYPESEGEYKGECFCSHEYESQKMKREG